MFDLQEARAQLGRCEYRKGNIEVALYVSEGIDIAAVTPKIKVTISRAGERQRYDAPPISVNAISLLLEAIFLKAKSLQSLEA
ncbi:hypothetical protein M0R45_001067 [Rubus argutus]|uniref:Uncharacterized protein n=1 Tax=Rubus argutus TaxID=59490 RepID=A0AAW1VNW8_RUBAR